MISLQQDRQEARKKCLKTSQPHSLTASQPHWALIVPLVLAILAGGAYAAGGSAVQSDTKQAAQALLAVGSGGGDVGSLVSIPATLTTNGTQPSIIIFWIEFDSTKLAFDHVETGAAAVAAGKEATANVSDAGVVRFCTWGMTTDAIGDGVVLTATFKILGGASGDTLLLTGASASMADPAANAIDQKITNGQIDIACMGRPQNVAASQDQPDGVLVTWGATAGATGYQVYRSDTNDAATAQSISSWLDVSAVSYLDESAVSRMGCGCFGLLPEPVYYYWVRAQGDAGCESLLAGSVAGSTSPANALFSKTGASMGGVFGLADFQGAEGDILLVLVLVTAAFLASARRNYELRITNYELRIKD